VYGTSRRRSAIARFDPPPAAQRPPEPRAFHDSHEVFLDAGADVIGISSDSVGSHEKFAGRHRLPFVLLSDEGGAVRRRYGVPTTLGLIAGRVIYVIDRDGIVRHNFSSLTNIDKHVGDALAVVKRLQAGRIG
jgi:thioredoxin-dependent peroxiredoxin